MEIDYTTYEFEDWTLDALEVDKINSTCPDLTEEEQAIHYKYAEE